MKSGGCHMLQLFFSLVTSWCFFFGFSNLQVDRSSVDKDRNGATWLAFSAQRAQLEDLRPSEKSTVMLVQRGLDGDVNMCLWE